MKLLKSIILILIFPTLLLAATAEPPVTVIYVVDNNLSTMTIKGGSTVGSWDADINSINASFNVNMDELNSLGSQTNGVFSLQSFSIPVKDIDSESGNRMTRNIHNYLKESNHPNITFSLKDAELTPNPDSNGSRFEVNASGTITAAGVSNDVTFTLTGELHEDGSISFKGMKPLTFSDFNIDRPSAMLGTVRASEDMEIHYHLVLKRQ